MRRLGLGRLWPYLLIVAGLALCLVPVAGDVLAARQAEADIASASAAVSEAGTERRAALLEDARAYNRLLVTGGDLAEAAPYDDLLRVGLADMACHVSIPSIGVDLPVFHGGDDARLMEGVGHVEGSSLPVGGSSTHCVLSGHSAMPGARLFDDIRLLEPGDLIVVWTLDEPYAYEVTGSEVVEPSEVGALSVRPGEDLCTLVTCTPYGVNSHRLLVHARRCAYEATASVASPAPVSTRSLPFLVGLCALVALAAGLGLAWLWRSGRRRALYALAGAAVLAGVGLMLAPAVGEWLFARRSEERVASMGAAYDRLSDAERAEALAQARAYNALLAKGEAEMAPEEVWPYDEQLAWRGEPGSMMSWLEVGRLGLRLPIYHHYGEAVLTAGVGHLDWTALPVGGAGTRCALSAHTGLEGARLFDDLGTLEAGDEFVLWTLGEPYAYEVVDLRVVAPNEVGELEPVAGKDLCTLVTCTPPGKNTHRLLVTGERRG